MARPFTPPEIRFWKYVDKTDTCWLWTGSTAGSTAQYPLFWNGQSKEYAHRWAYKHFVGPIPDGKELDHVAERGCTSKLCVNPAHLEPVTHVENRKRSRLTVCRSGRHDLTDPANVRWSPQGRRGCLACWREAQTRRGG